MSSFFIKISSLLFMNFFKILNFPLKSSEILIGLRFQLASVMINFTDNRDYRAVLYSMVGTQDRDGTSESEGKESGCGTLGGSGSGAGPMAAEG